MSNLILYTYFRSSAAYRVRLALHIKGLPFEARPVPLLKQAHRQEAYLQVNPQGLVPTLVDGDVVLTQSLAIIEYLEEVYPHIPLLPAAATARAQARAVAAAIACDIHPLNNLRVLDYLGAKLGVDEAMRTQWYEHWIQATFPALETQVQSHSHAGRYCIGDAVSVADCFLIPQVFNARRFNVDLSAYSALVGIYTHCMTLPAFQQASPERQADAV